MREFSETVTAARDEEMVSVRGEAGFLKRSFIAVELSSTIDEDDGGEDEVQLDGPPPVSSKKKKKLKQASKKAAKRDLEASLKEIVESAQANGAMLRDGPTTLK